MKPIAADKWKWFGFSGHFICGQWCRFHLATQVGGYLISTIGQYVHPRHSGGGERAEGEWLADNPNGERIGAGPHCYETMVFKAGQPCADPQCACGLPTINGSELAGERYMTPGEATEGHLKFCKQFAEGKSEVSQ